ncbi:hypothetical protein [Williamsia sp. R60]
MPIHNGSQKMKDLHIGGTKIGAAHMWNGSSWVKVYSSAPTLIPSGLTFGTTTTNLGVNIWTDLWNISTWVVRTGYEGTVQNPNGKINIAGAGNYTLNYGIRFGGSGTANRGARVLLERGGQVYLLHQTEASTSSVVRTGDPSVQALYPGDVIYMQGICNHSTSTSRRVNNTSPGTYFTIDPVV